MKGAFLITEDAGFFEKAKNLLLSRGALYVAEEGAVQIGGRGDDMLTLYSSAEPEWEYRQGPFVAAPGVVVPDMSAVTGLAVECNSEQYFADIIRQLALASEGPSWVLDGDGTVWAAREVDPTRIRL
jgi:hypothetical protein